MSSAQDKEKKDLLKERISRRSALKVGIAAAAAAVVAGGAVYLGTQTARPAAPSNVTVTAPTTITPASSAVKPKITLLLATSYIYETQLWMESKVYSWATKNNVDVDLQWISPNQHLTKMAALIEAGTVPDMFSTSDGLGIYAEDPKTRLLLPLDDVFNAAGGKDDWLPALLSYTSMEGTQYAIPWTCETNAVMWRRDLFESVGVTKWPATWDELYADCVKLKTAKPSMYPFCYAMGHGDGPASISTLIWSNDGYFMKGRSVPDIGFNSINCIEAIKYIKEKYWDTKLMDPTSLSWAVGTENNQTYLTGESALIMNGPSALASAVTAGIPWWKTTDYIPMPQGPRGTEPRNNGYSRWIGVYKDTKHPDLCKDLLITVFSDVPGLVEGAKSSYGQQGPPRKSALEEYRKLGGWHAQVATACEQWHFNWPLGESSKLWDTFTSVDMDDVGMWKRITVDGWTVEDAVAEAYNTAKALCLKFYGT